MEDCLRAAPDRPRLRRHRLPRMGDPARPADGAGGAGDGVGHRPPGAGGRPRGRRAHRCRRTRSRAGGARRRHDRRRPHPAPAQRHPAARHPSTPGGRGPARLPRQVRRAVAALRLPRGRLSRGAGPAHAAARAGLGPVARPRRDEQGVGTAGGPPRLRDVLQAAGGRHHDPHAARADLGARRGGGGGCHRAGRRVLPQHGALAGRLPDRDRRGTASRRLGRRDPAGRGARPRRRSSRPRTG